MTIQPSKPLEADAEQIGQRRERRIPITGEARIESDDIEVIDRVPPQDTLKTLAFMEELVTVVVHKSHEKNAEAVVTIWNDGRSQPFVRGVPNMVKRKFVECLARAKLTVFDQDVHVDRSTGEGVNRMIPNTGLKYPFDVIQDKNPRGRAWLQSILAEE
jgi:hypothetical protein